MLTDAPALVSVAIQISTDFKESNLFFYVLVIESLLGVLFRRNLKTLTSISEKCHDKQNSELAS